MLLIKVTLKSKHFNKKIKMTTPNFLKLTFIYGLKWYMTGGLAKYMN